MTSAAHDYQPGTALTAQVQGSSSGSTAVAVHRGAVGLMKPIAPVHELMAAQKEIREYVKQILVSGTDYGVVPGTGTKPTLMKAGAEKVALAFGLTPEFVMVEQTVDHVGEYPWLKRKKVYGRNGEPDTWQETRGNSIGMYRYVVRCDLRHRESGVVVASCIGVCSTLESKYSDRPRETENTVLKMAQKRAFVGAALHAAGLSDEFTQDVEDFKDGANMGTGDAAPRSAAAAPAAEVPPCPKCKGAMWDNRAKKAAGDMKPNAPDFKCKDQQCGGVVWPPREGEQPGNAAAPSPAKAGGGDGATTTSGGGTAGTTRSATSTASAGAPATTSDPAAFPMPFGQSKNVPLGEIDTKDIEGALQWAGADKTRASRYAGFIAAANDVLIAREKAARAVSGGDEPFEDFPGALEEEADDLPF